MPASIVSPGSSKPEATRAWRGVAAELAASIRQQRFTVLGFVASVVALGWLVAAGLDRAATTDADAFRFALLGGGAGFLATAAGALPALLLRRVAARTEDVMLGFAAGMMLAATVFSLLQPGLDAGERILGGALPGAALVVLGMSIGVATMLGLDRFTPHLHEKVGPCGPGHERCSRVWLFVFAIALHNLPEGMAVGAGFSQGDLGAGLPLAFAIALQDGPEGLAVAFALRTIGLGSARAVLIAIATGLLEPLGAIFGVTISTGPAFTYPLGLGIAAGAMLFVVSHEVIPETHRNGHQTLATMGLMAGFATMMVLDTTLG